jgi:hypothetical protein
MALSADELELNSVDYIIEMNDKEIFLGKLLQREISEKISENIFIFEYMLFNHLSQSFYKSKRFYEADTPCCCFPMKDYTIIRHEPFYMVFTPR